LLRDATFRKEGREGREGDSMRGRKEAGSCFEKSRAGEEDEINSTEKAKKREGETQG